MELKIDRSIYDEANAEQHEYEAPAGLNEAVVRKISQSKNEPEWMLQHRLKGLKTFFEKPTPTWGPDISTLNTEEIVYFISAKGAKNARNWEDVPQDIKRTFQRLGIPEAEQKSLAGAGAQYESEMAYHNLKVEWESKGVIFLDMDEALKQHEELVKEYFMKCVPYNDHKFAALHAAVWSGGTFLYIPKNVKVTQPLQAYFRMNAKRAGQFEHTLIIVEEGADVHYIEGCFTAGTTVATLQGDKPVETIEPGDEVLTHTGEHRLVYHTQEREHNGVLFSIRSWGDSVRTLNVTDKHPILFVRRERKKEKNKEWQLRWGLPKHLQKGDYLVLPRDQTIVARSSATTRVQKWNNKTKEMETLRVEIPSTKEFFRLAGYYLAEGSVSSDAYLNFSFNSAERFYIEDVKSLLAATCGVEKMHESEHKMNNGTSVVVCSALLARSFNQFGTAANRKAIPQWMLHEDKEKQKELLIGLFRGDGNYYKKKCTGGLKEVIRLNTVSQTLAFQVQSMLRRLGIPAFINKRDRRKEERQTMYTVGVTGLYLKEMAALLGIEDYQQPNPKKRASIFHVDANYLYAPIKEISAKEVESLPVFTFGVMEDETYTANGIAVQNCSAPQYLESSLHAGCVEVFVKKGARARYSSVENWSRNTYNLNTKRSIVDEDGIMEWVGGNLGSGVTMLYPCTILRGKNSRAEHISIAFAAKGQNQDTGAKIYHLGKNTSSHVTSKSIAVEGGITTYRGLIKINKGAKGAKSAVECDALMVDNESVSNTYPFIDVKEADSDVGHEATVGRISDEDVFYLQSRGIAEDEAKKLIVRGFLEPVTKALPLEYAVELNKLIELEMEGSLG